MGQLRLRIEGTKFVDDKNREVTIRGINCASDSKLPARPNLPSHIREHFFDGDNVSFVGRPFSTDDAHTHFTRLRRYGYNTLRYCFAWEAIEHAGPGKYDEEWIRHTIAILRIAKEYGFYIFMDPHQDVWSRFTGGSGAPMWTLYAAGLDPEAFLETQAAFVHCTWPEPEFPKMIWPTNYYRLACQVMNTLFFAGKDFAPKCIIDGQNISDYLQGHFIDACSHLARRINEAGDLEHDVVIGWESMNEPNRGLIGFPDISVIPKDQRLQKGTSPTAWQAILLGSGRKCEVAVWGVGGMGPYKMGSEVVDPKGKKAWLSPDYDDTKYGWKRDPGWELGRCIWAQHGVWDEEKDELLRKDYFATPPDIKLLDDAQFFMDKYFVGHFRKYRAAIKSVMPEAIIFIQPTPFEIPPAIKGTADDTPDLVYTPHFYDGITLMLKSWNKIWNVDVLGIMRGRYLTPAFAIKLGENAIRNCIRDQLAAMRKEGLDNLGDHPCIFSEIGAPFDLDSKYAYKTGDYASQVHALDANHYGIEGSGVNGFALWTYCALNNHERGDLWNGEDFSINSVDDKPMPMPSQPVRSPPSTASTSASARPAVTPANLRATLSTPDISPAPSTTSVDLSASGYRAVEAVVRPSPIYTAGQLNSYSFDLWNCVFSMSLTASAAAWEDAPTEIFLPEFHYPKESISVQASSGKWTITSDESDGGHSVMQRMKWWHGAGECKLEVRGLKRKIGAGQASGDEEGYLEQCKQNSCGIM